MKCSHYAALYQKEYAFNGIRMNIRAFLDVLADAMIYSIVSTRIIACDSTIDGQFVRDDAAINICILRDHIT